MSEKGECSQKSNPRGRRERRDSQDTSNMSMKVNVMYRGIVYRVRGVKVLCSVITAVILLLVAIVALGVWMLVSAYAEEKAELYTGDFNTSTILPQELDSRGNEASSTVVSIDFNAPSVALEDLSVPASIPSSHPSENIPFSETIGHFQGITPGKELKASSRSPGPDPPFGLFNGLLELGFGGSEESSTVEYVTSTLITGDWTPVIEEKDSDSMIDFSENRPMIVRPPNNQYNDYGEESLHGFIRDSNYYQDYEGNPDPISDSPIPDLPEDLPRDIDPTSISAELPFPFSPASPNLRQVGPRPGRRRNNQRQRPGLRRIPPGVRPGQIPPNPSNHRLPGYQRPLMPFDHIREYPSRSSEELSYDQRFDQQRIARPQENLPTQQPSTVREAQTEPFEGLLSHNKQDHSILQQYSSNEGGRLPEGITLPPGFKLPDDAKNGRFSETDARRRRPLSPASYLDDMMHYYNKHERNRNPSSSATLAGNQYSQRKGISLQEGDLADAGSHQNTSDNVFKHFWDVYDSQGNPPAHHEDRGPVPEETVTWVSARHPQMFPHPNIRGPRPNGQGYPIHVRPDAESPDRMLLVDQSHPPRRQQTGRPPVTPPNQHHSFFGPLHDIYQYSQRLAATLLNFPSNLLTQVDDSRAEYMQKEVELLEDYNKVFQQPNVTSTDVLPDMFDDRPDRDERVMLLDTEKIRSLNPFELSLITWTFLDFWEFLIEKVGTLSREDLLQLERRLERLRKQKDHRMAKNLITATVDRISESSSRDQPDVAEIIIQTEELLKSVPEVDENFTNNGSSDEVQGRMWDPLGIFSSEQRVKFMEFSIKVLFKFGRVYLKKKYALDCVMLLFCKDLNTNSKKEGMDGMVAKVKSVGLKVLTEPKERQMDTIGEVWRALTAWETLHCESMFPRCDGPKALEIVNEVALGTGK